MCLISTEIQQVSKTKILVAPNSDNTRQLVVYSNYVNNVSNSNAMVLPVPLPHTIKFIDLSNYTKLFDDCDKCFYNPNRSMTKSFSLSTNSYGLKDSAPLEVFNVGSYKVSLAMNLEQISRVDARIFELSSGLKQTLQMFYYQPYWGFIICKLAKGPESYHPFAYSHDIIDSKIYIPTRHYHQEVKWSDVNSWALGLPIDPHSSPLVGNKWDWDNIDNSPMFKSEQFGQSTGYAMWDNMNNEPNQLNGRMPRQLGQTGQSEQSGYSDMTSRINNLRKLNDKNYKTKMEQMEQMEQMANQTLNPNQTEYPYKTIADDWSHSIYMLNLNPYSNEQIKRMNSCVEIWDKKSLFDPEQINFDFGYCNSFIKTQINGTHPNIDLVIPVV